MKRRVVFCILFVALILFGLCACSPDYLQNASKGLCNYQIDVTFDEQHKILSVCQTVTFVNDTQNTFDSLKFHIYANAYRENARQKVVQDAYLLRCFPNGVDFGDITFDSVSVNGVDCAFVIEGVDCDILSVPLEKTLFPDEKVEISFVFEVKLANAHHRLGWGENTINCANFFPILCVVDKNGTFKQNGYSQIGDPFVSEVANFEVTLNVPSNFVIASTGSLVSKESQNDRTIWGFSAIAVRDFAFVASKNFQVLSHQNEKGVVLEYYYFEDDNAERSFEVLKNSFELYCDKIAPYPYATLKVAQADFCFGGMEYPQLATVSATIQSYHEAIAHEIAHQWFYALVGNDQIDEPFLDEGLAEFLMLYYIDKDMGVPLNENVAKYRKNFAVYSNVLTNYLGNFDTSMRSIEQFENEQDYVCCTYVKGALMFNALFENLGEDLFFRCLKNYFDNFKLEIATLDDMIACFERTSNRELENFFRSFVGDNTEIFDMTK